LWGFVNMANSLEILANRTTESLELITAEMVAIRTVVMQNRLALDYLLSSQGGRCAVIGAECCTYIPDNSEEITDLIQKSGLRAQNIMITIQMF
uniref:ERVV2 protein n=1 Tax=Oncorhynchus kisutch TaxID=8019 RepID=A0A8C7MKQ8_ONCKI